MRYITKYIQKSASHRQYLVNTKWNTCLSKFWTSGFPHQVVNVYQYSKFMNIDILYFICKGELRHEQIAPWHGKAFCITDPLWIPFTKGQYCGPLILFLLPAWTSCWSSIAGDVRRHAAHMTSFSWLHLSMYQYLSAPSHLQGRIHAYCTTTWLCFHILRQIVTILQTTFSYAFYWKKCVVF